MIGWNWTEMVHPDDVAKTLVRWQQSLETGELYEVEFRLKRASDGTYRWNLGRALPLRDEAGRIVKWFGTNTDITERKAIEKALEAAKEEAERANVAKSEFLSRMSHELRTPMNAILGFGQLLEMDVLDEEQSKAVQQILKGGRHLLELINEVLDLARIESEQPLLEMEAVAIADILPGVLDLVQPLAAPRRIELRADWDGAARLHILADRRRLNQALLNLLSNAVKYNCDGGTATLAASASDEQWLRITVSDTGPGIAAEKMDQLFTPFARLGAENTGVEGTGLGLALSKKLIEAMGGGIIAHSAPGQGSVFTVELPLAPAPLEDNPLPVESQAVSSRQPAKDGETQLVVLYIEDNLSNLGLVQDILRHRPEVKLLAAMQGMVGIELAIEHCPNLILLDVHLPDINGDEVLRRLREEAVTREIPVIVVSADATPHQIERLLAAGAESYMTKPLDVKRFLAMMDERLLEQKAIKKLSE